MNDRIKSGGQQFLLVLHLSGQEYDGDSGGVPARRQQDSEGNFPGQGLPVGLPFARDDKAALTHLFRKPDRLQDSLDAGVHLDLLEDETPERISILELSSFQLMTLSVSPDVGVVLRVSTEHLDWHKTVEEYRDAKANLVRWQKRDGACVYLKDAEPTAKIASESPAKTKYAVSLADGPSAGDGDAVIEGATLTIGNDKLELADCKVRGIYQLENMAAATLAVKALGIKVADAFEALKSYETLPFRMEFKGEKNGIEFYNDSYATRPDATIAATASMKRPFALILGGSEKNADFTELSNILVKERPNLKQIALIGATAERMLADLKKAGVDEAGIKTALFPTLEEAFANSLSIGKGGTVIMSPACASFGLFKNYKVRGQVFDKLVAEL